MDKALGHYSEEEPHIATYHNKKLEATSSS
jgi:hypothetical protein